MKKDVYIGWSSAYHHRNISHCKHSVSVTYGSGKLRFYDFDNLGLACAFVGRTKKRHPDAAIVLTEPCQVEPHFFQFVGRVQMAIKEVGIQL